MNKPKFKMKKNAPKSSSGGCFIFFFLWIVFSMVAMAFVFNLYPPPSGGDWFLHVVKRGAIGYGIGLLLSGLIAIIMSGIE